MTDCWIAFPSGNSQAAQDCVAAWAALGWRTAVFIDEGEPEVKCDLLVSEVFPGNGHSYNRLLAKIGDWRIAACVNDDMFPIQCSPRQCEAAMQKHFGGPRGVIQPTGCPDPNYAHCAPSPIIGREYSDRLNGGQGPWRPDYWHIYGDQEMKEVAEIAGCFAADPALAIEHRHHSRGFADLLPSEKRKRNNEQHGNDRAIFLKRQYLGFPGAL